AWVRRDYPDGFTTQPLNWLDTFLDDPKHLDLFPEERKLDFAQAVYGNPQCQSLYRFREGRPTLEWQCRLRNPFIDSLLGFGLLNEVRAITIDGQPIVPSSNAAQGSPLDFATWLRLPALAPGRHILKAEVLSALAPAEDVSSLTTGSPSTAWPPTKRRWTRTAQSELMVYARDAEIVSQTQDPALDPSALISVKRVVIRQDGANSQAVVELEIGDKLPVPVSFDGSMRLGGSTVQCSGSVLSDGASSQATGMTAQIPALDPGIKETEITLIPDTHAVEEQPNFNRIWGKPIVFSHVPLTRWDQQQSPGAPAVDRPLTGSAQTASAADPPQLRFLAWQDENTDLAHWRAWHPDGSPVVDPDELKLIGRFHPAFEDVSSTAEGKKNPRFLFLWFSHPGIDEDSFKRVTLFDAEGKPLASGAGSYTYDSKPPDDSNGNTGWIDYNLSPGDAGHMPASATIRLEYSAAPWAGEREIPSDYNGTMSLGSHVMLGLIGQNADGHAFISITRSDMEKPDTQYSFIALLRDGRELKHTGFGGGGFPNLTTETSTFPVALAEVKAFRLRTSPIKTVEFKNVPLERSGGAGESNPPGGAATAANGFGPVVEREVPRGSAINLLSGKMSVPAVSGSLVAQWLTDNNLNAVAGNGGLGGYNYIKTNVVTLTPGDWDTATPAQLTKRINAASLSDYARVMAPDSNGAATYAICTSAGTGIIQILGPGKNNAVKIRYKFAWPVSFHDDAGICAVARDGALAKLNALLKDNPYLAFGKSDESDKAPLHWAAEFGHKDVAQALLDCGVDINARTSGGDTPLHLAAEFGNEEMVEFLAGNGASIDAVDYTGLTPLITAARKNRLDVVKFLVSHGADVNAGKGHLVTALYWAAQSGNKEMAEFLLANKAEVDAKDLSGGTPLFEAALGGHEDVAELLLAKGADVNARDKYGNSPLHMAVVGGSKNLVELLLSNGADVNAANNDHKTPLGNVQWGKNGAKDIAQLLRDHGGRE
ncbi:MAG TPA: ankyrin repeat domain-containing protein, partial [Chthoniobacteraceae bacterium]|nr:ankyrin repeat domain-containing protein [Chthoniobacteraceae bacterium]